MSTDHRTTRTRWAAVAVPPLAVLLLAAAPAASRADTAEEGPGPSERLAAALEESPVYVDPTYASALPEDLVQQVENSINDSGAPLRVVAVPMIEGGDWNGDSSLMVSAVHDRSGADEAHYLVLDGRSLSGHDFEAGGERTSRAFYGSEAASVELGRDAPAAERLERAVEVALSDDPEGIYDTAREQQESAPFDWRYSLGPGGYTLFAVLPWVLAALALLGLGFGLHRWRRPRPVPVLAQHAAFDNANRARRSELARRAGEEVVELGERLSQAAPTSGDGAAEALHRALDAHAAARRVYDRLPDTGALEEIAGVLVLLDMAEDHLDRATRPVGRQRSAPLRSHCYANPLHGTVTKVTKWREFGGRNDIRVPLCAPCAKAVRDRQRPTVLSARYRGREVPYYEVPAEESVWAATGYGALREDLVERVLRGDRRGRTR
ncbi:hypothetical protein [Nocardiopsis ganjiahuensis]|uniref:hypothetical protein n=1 Tax=Nocardiopsis ganjiahuensis TaxID=239984 RepID=UPI00034CAA58|nr:hypothetical protein [Nocardiopsis ganjiahuensis]